MKKIQYLMIALLCTVAQGAWAQGIYGPTDIYNESDLNWYISNGFRNLVLKADIALNNYVAIGDGKIVTIDLNGHDLGRGLSELTSYGNVIRVETGGTLTIKDSGTGGTITGGYDASGGAICIYGTVNFEGGTISGCKGSEGGAIYVVKDGTVNMTGGTITGNTATDGGGIYNNGTLTISGGTITGNNVTEHGGGAVSNHGTLTVNGGSFTNNSTVGNGGGIWSNQNISMSGSVTIKDNTNAPNNLYLSGSSTKINVTGAMTGSNIYVSLSDYDRTFTSGFGSNNSGAQPSDFFTPDVDGLSVTESSGEAYISSSGGVLYMECSWVWNDESDETKGGYVVKTQKLATSVNGFHIETDQTLNDGWYQFVGTHEYSKRIVINGDVKFILYDDCNIEFKKGIHINKGRTLTIYSQSYGSNMGTLRCTGDDGSANNGDAAIGGNNNVTGGNLVIHGGTITAKPSHNCAAGIGGGQNEASGMQSVVIYGGTIIAQGTSDGAGIGCGENNNTRPAVTIYGGTVTAIGGSNGAGIGGGENRGNGVIKIYGGTVNASGGDNGAGIGGGKDGSQDNPIYIYGGTVNATGGEFGAGIGGGADGNGNITDIYGGNVYATGGELAPGIGSGGRTEDSGNPVCGTVTFHGGYVEATSPGGSSSCIGGGLKGKGGTVNFYGGTVKAIYTNQYSNKTAASTHSDEVYDGQCYVGRGGADYGNKLDKGTINFGSGMMVTDKSGNTVSSGSRVSACQEEPDYTRSTTVTITACDHEGATYTIKDADYHTIGNCSYCLMGGTDEAHTFGSYGECGVCGLVSLADDADNSSTIDHWAGETKSVVLTGRKLYKDGNWNTLCLPFAATLSGDLASATVKELDTENEYSGRKTGYDDGTLYLYFKDGPDMLQSGQPYIVKWANTENYVESPVFTNVVFGNGNPTIVTSKDDKVSLVGNFDPVTIGETDDAKHNLYLGAGNTLYYPTASDFKVNAFRAYFHLNGITAGEPTSGSNGIRAFSLHFGNNSEQTGIATTNYTNFTNSNNSWYTLDGRKLNAKPTAKGIYIYKGKKRIIK